MRCKSHLLYLFLFLALCSFASPLLAQGVPTPGEGTIAISTPTFVSVLTLAVTIIAAALAVFGVVSLWGINKIRQLTNRAKETVSESQEYIEQQIEEVHGLLQDLDNDIQAAHAKIQCRIKEIQAYGDSVKYSAGAFSPSGVFLSDSTRAISQDMDYNKSTKKVIEQLIERMSHVFLAHAEFGLQIQNLFVGTREEIVSSIAYLSQKPSPYTFAMLADRLEMEKRSSTPDINLVATLATATADMKRFLGSPTAVADEAFGDEADKS